MATSPIRKPSLLLITFFHMNHQDLLVNAGPGGVSAEMIHKLSFCPEQIFDKELCTYYAHPREEVLNFFTLFGTLRSKQGESQPN